MNVRLRDVADHAGVSFKTVSNVINHHPHVSAKTRARVEAAIKELGYRPNQTARSLRFGRSGFIGFALPELTSPYFATLASEVSAVVKRHGQSLVIEETNGERASEMNSLTDFSSRIVDGVIFSPLDTTAQEIAARMGSTPMVFLGEHEAPEDSDRLMVDNVAAARDVVEHLLALGRRRIAIIGYQRERGTGTERWGGVRQALEAAGVEPDQRLVASTSAYHRASGARAMADLLDSRVPFDAVFCFNDLLALGAMHTLLGHGVRVPEDVAVAGFDDIEDGRFHRPSLTTIAPDVPFLAEEAVRLLHRRMAESSAPGQRVTVPHRLMARQSTLGQEAREAGYSSRTSAP